MPQLLCTLVSSNNLLSQQESEKKRKKRHRTQTAKQTPVWVVVEDCLHAVVATLWILRHRSQNDYYHYYKVIFHLNENQEDFLFR